MAQSLREDDGCLCEEARELLGRAALERADGAVLFFHGAESR